MTIKRKDDSAMDPRHPALSPTRPLFIDNRDGNTLDKAIAEYLRTLRREMALAGSAQADRTRPVEEVSS